MNEPRHSTTVLCVAREGRVALGGDGQVTLGHTIIKAGARKVRALDNGRVLCGFAGGAADGLALMERFERSLSEHGGVLTRAAVEMAKTWRLDKALRRLEAAMIVADRKHQYLMSGQGDLIEPDDGVLGVGSGAGYAMAAARALLRHTGLDSETVVREALGEAARVCIYTNTNLEVLTLDADKPAMP